MFKKRIPLFLAVALFCGFLYFAHEAYEIYSDYHMSEAYYEKIRPQKTEEKMKVTEEEDGPWIDVDWDEMYSKDIIAWIYACDGDINYPVCYKAGDNDYFLHRLPDGSYAYAGSIFLSGACRPDFACYNSVIYGHNMRNGSMFKKLHNYEESGYFKKHKNFYIFTPDGRDTYKVYARHYGIDYTDVYTTDFVDDIAYGEWLKEQKDRAEETYGQQPDLSQKTISLSTCTTNKAKRLIIMGYQKAHDDYPR